MAGADKVVPTQNMGWGFWGTYATATGESAREVDMMWAVAMHATVDVLGCTYGEARVALDSSVGRHLADAVTSCCRCCRAAGIRDQIKRNFRFHMRRVIREETGMLAALERMAEEG